jgi:hypothetical protein
LDSLAAVDTFGTIGGPVGELDLGGNDPGGLGIVPGGKEWKDDVRDGTTMAGGWCWDGCDCESSSVDCD